LPMQPRDVVWCYFLTPPPPKPSFHQTTHFFISRYTEVKDIRCQSSELKVDRNIVMWQSTLRCMLQVLHCTGKNTDTTCVKLVTFKQLTQRRTIPFEKPVKKSPTFYEALTFVTALTKACHWLLSSAK
jgi:hypothetical protein